MAPYGKKTDILHFDAPQRLPGFHEGDLRWTRQKTFSKRPENELRDFNLQSSEKSTSWPLTSAFYDALTMDPTLLTELLRSDTQYADDNFPWFLEYGFVANGNLITHESRAGESHGDGIFSPSVRQSSLVVVHVAQERQYHKGSTISGLSVDPQTWIALLERLQILPSFLELLHSNNGGSLAHISYATNAIPVESSGEAENSLRQLVHAFHVGYKVGNWGKPESAIYARHDIRTGQGLVMLFSTSISMRLHRLQPLFRTTPEPNIFHVVFVFQSMILETVEQTRWELDHKTQALESQTGITTATMHLEPLNPETLRFNRELQVMAEFSMFVADGSGKMQSNLKAMQDHMKDFVETCGDTASDVARSRISDIQRAIQLKLSLAEHQQVQTRQLQTRLLAQLDITKTLIAQRDTQVNIELAEAAKIAGEINVKIARAAKLDSQLMRGIAVVTMIFLPATFFATFFSMSFFHVGNEASVRLTVDGQIWLYPTVTLPLTFLAVAWYWVQSRYLPKTKEWQADLLIEKYRS